MTDESPPEPPATPSQIDVGPSGPPPPLAAPPPAIHSAPPPAVSPPAPTAAKAGGKGAIVIVGVIIAFLAVVLFVVRNNGAAEDLKAGDCFELPTATSVQTVVHHPCTEAHTAEVFHVAEYTGTDMKTPITFVLEGFVNTACSPVFTTYVGKDPVSVPDLTIGYFYPSSDSWSSGDRTITCYVSRSDNGSMTKSVKGSAGT